MTGLKQIIFSGVLITLFACSVNDVKDETSPFYAVPVGSSIVLNQDVTISGNQVAIYVQYGKLMSYGDVDKYRPNCKFEIYTMSEQARTVNKDTFKIIKVVDDIESSSLPNNTRLALLGNVAMFSFADLSSVYNYATNMYLSSDNQKDVYRMTCQHWEDINDNRHLTISQMRQAMGDIFTLILKTE